MKSHILYRFLDEHGRLLYVGITVDPVSRFRQHKQSKAWWVDVRQIVMQHYDSRAELVSAEIEAIANERPLHNVMHNRPHSTVQHKSLVPSWTCHDCGKRAKGKDDVLWLSRAAVQQAEELENWLQKPNKRPFMSAADLDAIPEEGKWRVTCDKCWSDENEEYYVINLDRIATWSAVADWTAHMLEKDFLPFTNWPSILRNAGARE